MLAQSCAADQAHVRSHSGSSSDVSNSSWVVFRTLALERCRFLLQLSEACCVCGARLDSRRSHRAACARSGLQREGTDFGQSRFGLPDLTNFGQSMFGRLGFGSAFFGQSIFWPIHILANPYFGQSICICVCFMVGAHTQEKSSPKGGALKGGALKGGEAQNFALFSPSPASMFALFLSLSGCLLVEFWWCTLKCARLEFSVVV